LFQDVDEEMHQKILLEQAMDGSNLDANNSFEKEEDGQYKKIADFVLKHAKKTGAEFNDRAKTHRNRYSEIDLRKVLEMVDKIQDEAVTRSGKKLPVKKIVDYFRTQTAYKTLSESMITRWTKRMTGPRIEQKKRGRKVNVQFECDVFDDLLKTAAANALSDGMQDSSSVNGSRLVFDITKVSYDAVRLAAARVRSSGDYVTDKSVANLQFTNKWVDGIKRRFATRHDDLLSFTSSSAMDQSHLIHDHLQQQQQHQQLENCSDVDNSMLQHHGDESVMVSDNRLMYSSELVHHHHHSSAEMDSVVYSEACEEQEHLHHHRLRGGL